MKYVELAEFISKRMRMSHVYQPVMLMTLLQSDGKCDETEIAKTILEYDQSQIEYYVSITKNMVGRVLRRHGIIGKEDRQYFLTDYDSLSKEQVNKLISLCRIRLEDYLKKRGKLIWNHRRKSTGYISGTIKYEVLKRAKFHCELCGISASEKALEVDHIVPRNQGGSDDLSNLQSLCYSCNAMKRDRDSTNFREIIQSYKARVSDCIFCTMGNKRIISENELVYSIRDGFPVTHLHSLIIPKRHIVSYFELGQSEINACTKLMNDLKVSIENEDKTVTGFNIGINNGNSAGQTIHHCHIHLIPRRDGDIENPIGGIRNIIPGKGDYINR